VFSCAKITIFSVTETTEATFNKWNCASENGNIEGLKHGNMEGSSCIVLAATNQMRKAVALTGRNYCVVSFTQGAALG
jgi:DNA-binding IscR family transcriptional regulator